MAAKYMSSEPVTHLFDQLPTDMIYYEIFSYLDYNSRVTANLLLPQQDRLRTPLRKDAVLEFQMRLGTTLITSIIWKQTNARNSIGRNRLTLKIWRTVPKFPELFQYSAKFREVVAAKAVEFTEPALEEFSHISPYMRKELKRLCETFLSSLEKYPYIREVALSNEQENWSAV
jgi:hypothetical protein